METNELTETFDIDNGELNDIPIEHVFVLGYELAEVHQLMDRGGRFDKMIHWDNLERVKKSAKRRGVPLEVTRINDDWAVVRSMVDVWRDVGEASAKTGWR